jgi:hypothetical protein
MLRSLKIGSAFGIPIYVHTTFLILPLIVLAMHWGNLAAIVMWEALVLTIFGFSAA